MKTDDDEVDRLRLQVEIGKIFWRGKIWVGDLIGRRLLLGSSHHSFFISAPLCRPFVAGGQIYFVLLFRGGLRLSGPGINGWTWPSAGRLFAAVAVPEGCGAKGLGKLPRNTQKSTHKIPWALPSSRTDGLAHFLVRVDWTMEVPNSA